MNTAGLYAIAAMAVLIVGFLIHPALVALDDLDATDDDDDDAGAP